MGYYSTFSFNLDKVVVDKKRIEEIENYFANYENEDVMGFYNVRLPVSDGVDGKSFLQDIELADYYGKFYDNEVFAKKLKDAIKEGVIELSFLGEEGDTWGYIITPGKITVLRGVLIPLDFYPVYCKNCGMQVGYMKKTTFPRLGEVCDNCAKEERLL